MFVGFHYSTSAKTPTYWADVIAFVLKGNNKHGCEKPNILLCDLGEGCLRRHAVATDIINSDCDAWALGMIRLWRNVSQGATLWMSIFHALIMMPCVFDYVRTSEFYLEAYQELQPEVLEILTE